MGGFSEGRNKKICGPPDKNDQNILCSLRLREPVHKDRYCKQKIHWKKQSFILAKDTYSVYDSERNWRISLSKSL